MITRSMSAASSNEKTTLFFPIFCTVNALLVHQRGLKVLAIDLTFTERHVRNFAQTILADFIGVPPRSTGFPSFFDNENWSHKSAKESIRVFWDY